MRKDKIARIFGIDFITEIYWNSLESALIIDDKSILESVVVFLPIDTFISWIIQHLLIYHLIHTLMISWWLVTTTMNCFLVTSNIFLPKLKKYYGKEECITVNMFFYILSGKKMHFFSCNSPYHFSRVKLTPKCRIPIDGQFCIEYRSYSLDEINMDIWVQMEFK